MKIVAYGCREDEIPYLKFYSRKFDADVVCIEEHLSMETVDKAKGADGVSIVGVCTADSNVLTRLKEMNVMYLSTRSMGYNQIDMKKAEELGIRVCNANYSSYGVANFTVMLILVTIRKLSHILARTHCMDYSLNDIQGREMQTLTIGIIGTGKIGSAVAKNLSGFGSRVLAYTHHPNTELEQYVEYVTFDQLIKESDVIALHIPLTDESRHIINRDNIKKMKDGVILINTARGELIDTDAMIDGLESGKIGGAGIDSFEDEQNVIHVDHSCSVIRNKKMLLLKAFPNVTVTPHVAFFTDQTSDDMVRCSIEGLYRFFNGEENRWEVKSAK